MRTSLWPAAIAPIPAGPFAGPPGAKFAGHPMHSVRHPPLRAGEEIQGTVTPLIPAEAESSLCGESATIRWIPTFAGKSGAGLWGIFSLLT
jgi:hypothetical protein